MISWIILDSSYLIFRAQYAMSKDGNAMHGYVQQLLNLRERFDSDHFVHCFDSGESKRRDILPTYKQREPSDPEAHKAAKECMTFLRRQGLKAMGFENILYQRGYEADDIIASVCHNSLEDDRAVIVSTDHDFLQLLSSQTTILYNPNPGKGVTTEKSFRRDWFGLSPAQWSQVQSIAGCRTDNVPGVTTEANRKKGKKGGIGEKTAAKFIAGKLSKWQGSYQDITSNEGLSQTAKNTQLVRLPFPGTERFGLSIDEDINWRRLHDAGLSAQEDE